MKYYLEEAQAVLTEVKSSENGLTSAEAENRLAQNGKNKLKEAEKEGLIKKIISALADPMIIMLLVAAFIQAVVAVVQSHGKFELSEFADVLIILVVALICGALYYYGIPQRLAPALKVGDRTYSVAEYQYYYLSVYENTVNSSSSSGTDLSSYLQQALAANFDNSISLLIRKQCTYRRIKPITV